MPKKKIASKKYKPFNASKGEPEAGMQLDRDQLAALRRLRYLQAQYETLRLSQKEKI